MSAIAKLGRDDFNREEMPEDLRRYGIMGCLQASLIKKTPEGPYELSTTAEGKKYIHQRGLHK